MKPPMEQTICELVNVIVVDESGVPVIMEIPAYTVKSETLDERVKNILSTYLSLSEQMRNSVSLGDFALFLLAQAKNDPRRMD